MYETSPKWEQMIDNKGKKKDFFNLIKDYEEKPRAYHHIYWWKKKNFPSMIKNNWREIKMVE